MKTMTELKKILESRGFQVHLFATYQEAMAHFLETLKEGECIGYGGSTTLTQMGLIERLRNLPVKLLDRNAVATDPVAKSAVERGAFGADTFIASVNGIAETGELVNIDMWGNRSAPIEFGPARVCLFVGKNKWAKNLSAAIERARNIAAPKNTARFDRQTPCRVDERCHDCRSPQRICSIISIITQSGSHGRIQLYLIDQDLGF